MLSNIRIWTHSRSDIDELFQSLYRPLLLKFKFSFQLITRAKGNVKLYRETYQISYSSMISHLLSSYSSMQITNSRAPFENIVREKPAFGIAGTNTKWTVKQAISYGGKLILFLINIFYFSTSLSDSTAPSYIKTENPSPFVLSERYDWNAKLVYVDAKFRISDVQNQLEPKLIIIKARFLFFFFLIMSSTYATWFFFIFLHILYSVFIFVWQRRRWSLHHICYFENILLSYWADGIIQLLYLFLSSYEKDELIS